MSSGKTVIGCESGSSVLDRRGEIKAKVLTLLRDNPSYTFEQVASHLPQGWDSFSFYTIGPRHFEAIITKTCQVLVEGTYSGILKPDLHYISVKRDFSNLNEVIEKIKDVQLIQDITEQAYKDIYLCKKYSYQIFASQIEQVLLIL